MAAVRTGAVHDVILQPLTQIGDDRGKVMHMMRSDSPFFDRFGEIYFSTIHPGVVKAWKRHWKMTQHLTVLCGEVRFMIYDDRSGSLTCGTIQECVLGERDYQLLILPPALWYGFQCVSAQTAMLANLTDIPHHPDEIDRCAWDSADIPCRWRTS